MFSCSMIFSELFLCIFEFTFSEGIRTPWSVNNNNQEQLYYWHPAFIVNWRPMKIYWWINRMQKLQQNIIFFNWNVFINTIIPFFHMGNWHDCPNFISFLWMETWCMLDSPDKSEDDKLYSNAITQQNERQPDIVLDSRRNMMINLAF